MRPLLLALVLSTAGFAAAQEPPPDKAKGKDKDGELVTMKGCVSGTLLKSVGSSPGTVVGSLTASDRYRMVATKAMREEIKKANRALVQVTGYVKPGPRAVVKGTKMGGTTIGIGATQGTTTGVQAPYTPTIDVDSIEVIAKSCDAL